MTDQVRCTSNDETKNRQNQHKHGIAFGLAQDVFLVPLRITMETQEVDGEERFVTLAPSPELQTHGVVYALV